jgi:hypothetical protein
MSWHSTLSSLLVLGDKTTKYLNHETVFASGYQVVNLEMALPPPEEGLYAPAQLVNLGHFFSRQIVTVGATQKSLPSSWQGVSEYIALHNKKKKKKLFIQDI